MRVGYAWRKQGAVVKWVIEEGHMGKRLLSRPKLSWEDYVKKDTKKIKLKVRW